MNNIKYINDYKNKCLDVRYDKTESNSNKIHLICQGGSVGIISYIINKLYLTKNNYDKIYIENVNIKNGNSYDKIFNQVLTDEYEKIPCWGGALINYDAIILEDIRIKTQKFFKFNVDFINSVDLFAKENNIDENTIGVHVRMTDWNAWHGNQWGFIYYDDYVREIDKIINTNNFKNIFVASDNYESLNKLRARYGSIVVFNENAYRLEEEHLSGDLRSLIVKARTLFDDEKKIITAFFDFALQLKCGYFIGRNYSNFSKAAVILGCVDYNNIKLL